MHSHSSPFSSSAPAPAPAPPNQNGASGGLSFISSGSHRGGEEHRQQQQQNVGSGDGVCGSNSTLFSLNNKRRNDDHSSSLEDDSNNSNNNNTNDEDGERPERLERTMTPNISRDTYYCYYYDNHNNNDIHGSFPPPQQQLHSASPPSLPAWPVPDGPTMQARWNFRERIQRETMEHRRTILFPSSSNIPSTLLASSSSSSSSSSSCPSVFYHHHHSSNLNYSDHSHSINHNHVTTVAPAVRNICTILCDRERFGAQALSHGPRPPRPSRPPRKGGCSSPSTVLESLLTPTNGASASAPGTATLMDTSTPTTPKVKEPHISAAIAGPEEDEDSNGDGDEMDVTVPPSRSFTMGTSPDTTQGPPQLPLSSLQQQPSFQPEQPQQQQQLPPPPSSSSSALPLPNRPRQRVIFPLRIVQEVCFFGESYSATRYQSSFLHHLGGNEEPLDAQGQRPASSPAVSTISVAFSPDSQTLASTHGDHTVKISCCHSGRLLQSLEGHPRTPWTVKYHPTQAEIVASGCLGHQVRVWNWKKIQLLQMVRLEYAIISLSFHPSGTLLAIANGTRVHLWSVVLPGQDDEQDHHNNNHLRSMVNPTSRNNNGRNNSHTSSTPTILELDQRHMLRCVHFPPNGKTLILGGVNPITEDARRARSARTANSAGGGGMSFYLRLWDFDLERAKDGGSLGRRILSNPRTFVPRALLYNDGGFDVSPDGKTLCACSEYWLPDGVDNAMDLVYQEEAPYGVGEEHDIVDDSDIGAETAVAAAGSMGFSTEARAAVVTALSKLNATISSDDRNAARSPSFRDRPEGPSNIPRTPPVTSMDDLTPMTPPIPQERVQPSGRLSPPPPPGRRFIVTHGELRKSAQPPPPPAAHSGTGLIRQPHSLSVVSKSGTYDDLKGRYVPHVVTVSLDTDPIPEEVDPKLPRGKPYGAVPLHYRPRLGQLLEACPLDASKASAVTCVKFSPSTDFCLIGYGVREPLIEGGGSFHPVTALYRVRGGMTHVSTMLSGDDDVNIARFHPDSGYGFVYGTKQGRVRVLSPRPWNYYS